MATPLRIALVTKFYYPHLGGVTEHVQNLAEQLMSWGHSVVGTESSALSPSNPAGRPGALPERTQPIVPLLASRNKAESPPTPCGGLVPRADIRLSHKGRACGIRPLVGHTIKLTPPLMRQPSGSFGGLNRGSRDRPEIAVSPSTRWN